MTPAKAPREPRPSNGSDLAEDEVGRSEASAVEAAAEPPTPAEPPTEHRPAGPAPAWAWVAITLIALLLAIGLTTLAVVRNAEPSTPEAAEDMQTLVVELETLNGYLATTNELMSNAITNAAQLSAKAQAKLADLSAQVDDIDARVGQSRSLLGSQLSEPTRTKLGQGQEELEWRQVTLARKGGRLAHQQLASISRDVAVIGDEVGVATGKGSKGETAIDAIEAQIETLASKQAQTDELKAQLEAEAEGLRAEAEQLKAALQAQRQRAAQLAAQIRAMKRVQAQLQRRVARLSRKS